MATIATQYERPGSLAAAINLLDRPGAVVLAGGQTLLRQLKGLAVPPSLLVDISKIAELRQIAVIGEWLHIGAAATLSEIAAHEAVSAFPVLAEAIASTANLAVRNKGTLVGNLVTANASGELPVAVTTCDAILTLTRNGGQRDVAAADFFLGPNRSAVEAGEIIAAIRLPVPPPGSGSGFSEISVRSGIPPLVCAGTVIDVDEAGFIVHARVVVGGVTGRPAICVGAQEALIGAPLAGAAKKISVAGLSPSPELRYSNYALDVLPTVIARALSKAAAQIPTDSKEA